jgi:hypothetical protein
MAGSRRSFENVRRSSPWLPMPLHLYSSVQCTAQGRSKRIRMDTAAVRTADSASCCSVLAFWQSYGPVTFYMLQCGLIAPFLP